MGRLASHDEGESERSSAPPPPHPCWALMERGLTVYRHDSPGGRIVIITVDERDPMHVVARLQVERRTDPKRQGVGEPPLIAEARGASREAVLAELRALANDDVELARRLERWTAMQRRPRSDAP